MITTSQQQEPQRQNSDLVPLYKSPKLFALVSSVVRDGCQLYRQLADFHKSLK